MLTYKKTTVDLRSHFTDIGVPSRPGELLTDVIARSIQNSVALETGAPLAYDDDVDFVDPACDPRTDRFSVAEFAEHQRSASAAMTAQADASGSVSSESPAAGGLTQPQSEPEPAVTE